MTALKLVRPALALLLAVALVPLAAPPAAADDGTPHDCFRQGASSASIGNVHANGVALQTQVGGTTLELPRGTLALAISTTGGLDVEIHHQCVRAYHFVAKKTATLGTSTVVDVWAYPGCVGGTDTYTLPVGWDLVRYELSLDWYGCDGFIGHDHRDIRVVDP